MISDPDNGYASSYIGHVLREKSTRCRLCMVILAPGCLDATLQINRTGGATLLPWQCDLGRQLQTALSYRPPCGLSIGYLREDSVASQTAQPLDDTDVASMLWTRQNLQHIHHHDTQSMSFWRNSNGIETRRGAVFAATGLLRHGTSTRTS